jgi:argininosuccinate lyase
VNRAAPAPLFLLVESNTTGTGRLFAAAARARGLHPVLLSTRPDRYPWVAEDGLDVAWANTADPEAIALVSSHLASRAPLGAILSSSEYFVAPTARAAARLGLPGPSAPAIEQCRDKRRQRVALKRAGLPVPRFEAVSSVRSAVAAAADIGLPVVCKPVDGTGSRGVRLCPDLTAVAEQAGLLLSSRKDERGRPSLPWVLVEEYVAGQELSVETFGRRLVGVTAKHLGPLPSFVETGHDFPAPGHDVFGDTPGPGGETVAIALRAVEALGLGWGPAHTEVRMAPSGPVVVEVNPRLAGGQIPILVELATGLDLVGATVDLATGLAPTLTRPPNEPGPVHASIRFLVTTADGQVGRITGLEQAAAVPGVVDVAVRIGAGDYIAATGSFLDRVGHVIAVGSTPEAARASADRGLSAIAVELEHLGGHPGAPGEDSLVSAGAG